ncbi:sulfurtransferase-like selenium metabolism protein YedF [Halodesulfovibrio sp.]|jgi:selenium metabolism protein YedF|uniref:sulfurtransferase-like selenium metabolism protein YedF n=1 Tax=Halodesulfovibrio sp. TaxID=1912772 RepID=UPI0025DB22AE|nr:sulfurtransferase-like selenium metabolism protein YedF [Halodesulfovibrio sp.]MCT4534863.1 sulfurtransferase-like selenium metabolism protein YedF [Halodesulfovibrio sp.]MCT4627824.1 sulfurtransferase-like selenium metabolism protein YedF [Halodesulfovibrio sp.]
MSNTELNCLSLSCPQPVIQCKNLIEQEAPSVFTILVDNDAAKDNVVRFLSSKGYSAKSDQIDGGWRILATASDAQPCEILTDEELSSVDSSICVFITSATVGTGDDVLGAKLMKNFLATLPELGKSLWRIVMVNGAVTLAVEDSHVLEELKALEAAGVDILVCGTCLEHFGILDKKAVGETTNMLDIVTSMQVAAKVIRP